MNASQKHLMLTLALAVASLVIAVKAYADPIVGRDALKFSQKPMDATPIIGPNGTTQLYWGHDELSTAYSAITATGPTPYRGVFMADDFADKFSSPIVHVKWWGSYLNNFQTANIPVNKFLISFESDHPADAATGFSRPDQPLLNQIVRKVPAGGLTPGSGTYTEKPISPGGLPLNETLYEYNAELHLDKAFFEKADTVYWLKIVALVDLPAGVAPPNPNEPPTFAPRWGWHNRDYTIFDPLASSPPAVMPGEHLDGVIGPPALAQPIWHFQDDAVRGIVEVDHLSTSMGQIMPIVTQREFQPTHYLNLADGPPPIGEFSKDLAFELYTIRIPEPGSCLMFVCGCFGLILARRRRPRG